MRYTQYSPTFLYTIIVFKMLTKDSPYIALTVEPWSALC